MPTSHADLREQAMMLLARYARAHWGIPLRYVKLTLLDGHEHTELVPVQEGLFAPDTASPARSVYSGAPWHSAEFDLVRWPGLGEFDLTPKQAMVIAALWDAMEDESGDGERSQKDLLAIAESDCTRLHDLFSRSPAWGTLIVKGQRAAHYRLAQDASD